MAKVLILDIPDEIVKEVKQRVKFHSRSLQQEIVDILIKIARQPYGDIAQRAAEIRLKLTAEGRTLTDSTELLREDRSR